MSPAVPALPVRVAAAFRSTAGSDYISAPHASTDCPVHNIRKTRHNRRDLPTPCPTQNINDIDHPAPSWAKLVAPASAQFRCHRTGRSSDWRGSNMHHRSLAALHTPVGRRKLLHFVGQRFLTHAHRSDLCPDYWAWIQAAPHRLTSLHQNCRRQDFHWRRAFQTRDYPVLFHAVLKLR